MYQKGSIGFLTKKKQQGVIKRLPMPKSEKLTESVLIRWRCKNLYSYLKVSKNRNDFMKTSIFPKTNEIIFRISALFYSGQNS